MGERPIHDFVAALDQVSSALVDMAKALAGYYAALIEADVPHDTASRMVVEMQAILVLGNVPQDEDA